jgi:hypothetical protein
VFALFATFIERALRWLTRSRGIVLAAFFTVALNLVRLWFGGLRGRRGRWRRTWLVGLIRGCRVSWRYVLVWAFGGRAFNSDAAGQRRRLTAVRLFGLVCAFVGRRVETLVVAFGGVVRRRVISIRCWRERLVGGRAFYVLLNASLLGVWFGRVAHGAALRFIFWTVATFVLLRVWT